MIRKIFFFPQFLFDYLCNAFWLKVCHVTIGKRWNIRGRLFIRNHGEAIIGEGFIANCNMRGNPVGGPYSTSIAIDFDAKLKIGSNVGISGTAIMCCKEIIIDDNVMIGSGTCIYDTDFHSINYNKRINGTDTRTSPVHICEGVFIGTRSLILKGVTIGKHSVIGAGSVVTKSIPENEVWAGNPAKFVKRIEQ